MLCRKVITRSDVEWTLSAMFLDTPTMILRSVLPVCRVNSHGSGITLLLFYDAFDQGLPLECIQLYHTNRIHVREVEFVFDCINGQGINIPSYK